MPPPLFRLGSVVTTTTTVLARICLKRGYKKIELPPGRYSIVEIARDEEGWHVQELSDGYAYRLHAVDAENTYSGKRISIWQNDLVGGI